MRIAQVAPLWERVPPSGYGGIELIVSLLTDELVRRGHEVTLFASGDSQTLAHLESITAQALRLNPEIELPDVYEMLQFSQVQEQANHFDLINFHKWIPPLPLAKAIKTPTLYTLHSNFTTDHIKLCDQFRDQCFISISNAQRTLAPNLNYICTIYNGIDTDRYPFRPNPTEPPYLAFLGRMYPQKGPHHAIAIARKLNWPLKLAGKVDDICRDFFEHKIAPYIDGQQIEFLGEVNHDQKIELLENATITLFPITWQEPFGLVMVESMCVGTPVVALNQGSVPEIIAQGKTGFICSTVEEMAAATAAAVRLNRQECHDFGVRHFGVKQMVDRYEAAYRRVLEEQTSRRNGYVNHPVISLQL